MIVVISPAKSLDFENPPPAAHYTQPEFLEESAELVRRMRRMSASDLSDLMGINDRLSALNVKRFQSWSVPFNEQNSKPAAFAFRGDVYKGLAPDDLARDQVRWAQDHLRILSGLYGVLRPLDLIQPYRLEMGLPVNVAGCTNLYEFWGDKISDALSRALADSRSQTLVNLASKEYWKSVRTQRIAARVITPVFKDKKDGKERVISFYAKRARGAMVRHLCRKKARAASALLSFAAGGYAFQPSQSSDDRPVFVRTH